MFNSFQFRTMFLVLLYNQKFAQSPIGIAKLGILIFVNSENGEMNHFSLRGNTAKKLEIQKLIWVDLFLSNFKIIIQSILSTAVDNNKENFKVTQKSIIEIGNWIREELNKCNFFMLIELNNKCVCESNNIFPTIGTMLVYLTCSF